MSKQKYTYVYSVTECPSCGHDFKQERSLEIECVVDGKAVEVFDRLDHNGILQDEEGMVKNGKHSATFCGNCSEHLIDYEHQITSTGPEDLDAEIKSLLEELKS